MREYVESETTHNGYTVKIIADQDAQSPGEDGDNGLFLVTTRNRYFQVLYKENTSHGEDVGEVTERGELSKTHWVFPLRAYIHSGVALSLSDGGCFSDPWDSGVIGAVFAAKSEWKYRTRERKACVSAQTAAKGLVETWNQYLSGDVWGYVIEDADGNSVDSCWGFYGLEYAKQEAMGQVPSEPSCPSDSAELEETLS